MATTKIPASMLDDGVAYSSATATTDARNAISATGEGLTYNATTGLFTLTSVASIDGLSDGTTGGGVNNIGLGDSALSSVTTGLGNIALHIPSVGFA